MTRTLPLDDLTLREGVVPGAIEHPLRVTAHWQIGRDAFRLLLPSGLVFHYRCGRGTVFARPHDVSDDEVALFFDGSVRGAIAWLAGLIPLHASAVVHDGGVFAFTGASGEGKSTLAAALAKAGFSAFCDDVLVLDPIGAMALPGHKRLKLWKDALALTGHLPLGAVRPGTEKFFVEGGTPNDETRLPLRRLYVLDSLAPPAIVPIHGAQRFTELRRAYYRAQFGTALTGPAQYFRTATDLAERVAMRRFSRSRQRASFADGIAAIIADIPKGVA